MATKYIEAVGATAGDAATRLSGVLKGDAAGNVYPVVFDAVDGVLKYYDRVNSVVRQLAPFNPAPISATASTLTVTNALHAGRTIVLNLVGGIAIQLPAATGSGDTYRFVVGIASNANVLSAVVATDDFYGGYIQDDSAGTTGTFDAVFMSTAATSNTYSPTTLGGGGLIGDWFEVQDIVAAKWSFRGVNQGVVDPTDRFSAV